MWQVKKHWIAQKLSKDQILQAIADSINYNNMCARLTLGDLPKVTLEDFKNNNKYLNYERSKI